MPRVDKDGISRTTDEEREAMAKQAQKENKEEKKADKALKTEGVSKLESNVGETVNVGTKVEKKAVPDKKISEAFKYVPVSKAGWIKMTPEEADEYTQKEMLVGYDPSCGMGLLKKD